MPCERTQCLIFFAAPAEPDDEEIYNQEGQFHPVFKKSSTDKPAQIHAFLPETFINNHSDVVLVFQQNNIHIMRNEDKPQILAEHSTQDLEFVEIFLDDSPLATLDPLLVICDESDACFLFWLFSKSPIQLRRKRDEAINLNTRVRPVAIGKDSQGLLPFLGKKFTLRYAVYKTVKINQNILLIAACRGQTILAGSAADSGIDINRSYDGWAALHLAASEGHTATVRTLIKKGAIVDAKNAKGFTPLHFAYKHEEVGRILLENGADIHAKANNGWATLHPAASEGSNNVVRLLIEKGAVVDDRDDKGQTPLHDAWSPEIAETLLLNGADPNAVDDEKRTPILTNKADSVEIIRVLLKYGARVNLKLDGDSVSEVIASNEGRLQVLRYLLERYFLDPVLLVDSLKAVNDSDTDSDSEPNDVLGRHVLKIHSLNLQRHNFTNFDPARFQCANIPADFRCDCEVEVTRMKSQTLGETLLTVYDVLEKNDFELACLLRNDAIAQHAESDEWVEQYPIYGSVLTCHFENGKLRKSLQEEGMKLCSRLFPTTNRPLPDEIQDKILSYLNKDDLFNLKRAVPVSESQVKR